MKAADMAALDVDSGQSGFLQQEDKSSQVRFPNRGLWLSYASTVILVPVFFWSSHISNLEGGWCTLIWTSQAANKDWS